MELQLGSIRVFANNTETNANKMCPRSLHAVWSFMHVYLQAQTTLHTHLIRHGYFDCGKNLNSQIAALARIKIGQGLGSVVLYLWFAY